MAKTSLWLLIVFALFTITSAGIPKLARDATKDSRVLEMKSNSTEKVEVGSGKRKVNAAVYQLKHSENSTNTTAALNSGNISFSDKMTAEKSEANATDISSEALEKIWASKLPSTSIDNGEWKNLENEPLFLNDTFKVITKNCKSTNDIEKNNTSIEYPAEGWEEDTYDSEDSQNELLNNNASNQTEIDPHENGQVTNDKQREPTINSNLIDENVSVTRLASETTSTVGFTEDFSSLTAENNKTYVTGQTEDNVNNDTNLEEDMLIADKLNGKFQSPAGKNNNLTADSSEAQENETVSIVKEENSSQEKSSTDFQVGRTTMETTTNSGIGSTAKPADNVSKAMLNETELETIATNVTQKANESATDFAQTDDREDNSSSAQIQQADGNQNETLGFTYKVILVFDEKK